MTNKQFLRLQSFFDTKKRHRVYQAHRAPSKRSVRANGGGWGQVLKNSRIREQVHVETIFPRYRD